MITSAVAINHLTVMYANEPVLWDVSFSIGNGGTLFAIIGPNGGGKSSLLRTIVGLLRPVAGTIALYGDSWKKNRHKVAYIPQRSTIDWNFPVRVIDVVLMGCYGRLRWYSYPGRHERLKAHKILEAINMLSHAYTPLYALSGGQQQRVFLGRALMQEADLYLMDEPFIGIDMATEQEMMSIFKQMIATNKTVVVVHHDLQTVHDYFDHVLLLNKQVIACGATNDILMPEYICAAYGKANIYSPRLNVPRSTR